MKGGGSGRLAAPLPQCEISSRWDYPESADHFGYAPEPKQNRRASEGSDLLHEDLRDPVEVSVEGDDREAVLGGGGCNPEIVW
jgi:hypothetical protein